MENASITPENQSEKIAALEAQVETLTRTVEQLESGIEGIEKYLSSLERLMRLIAATLRSMKIRFFTLRGAVKRVTARIKIRRRQPNCLRVFPSAGLFLRCAQE